MTQTETNMNFYQIKAYVNKLKSKSKNMSPKQYNELQRQAKVVTLKKDAVRKANPYIDVNGKDRSNQIETSFSPTLEDIKMDPEFYAELVNDLMFHWMYGTQITPLMDMARYNYELGLKDPNLEMPI